jgi:hypothetical protein
MRVCLPRHVLFVLSQGLVALRRDMCLALTKISAHDDAQAISGRRYRPGLVSRFSCSLTGLEYVTPRANSITRCFRAM